MKMKTFFLLILMQLFAYYSFSQNDGVWYSNGSNSYFQLTLFDDGFQYEILGCGGRCSDQFAEFYSNDLRNRGEKIYKRSHQRNDGTWVHIVFTTIGNDKMYVYIRHFNQRLRIDSIEKEFYWDWIGNQLPYYIPPSAKSY